MADGEGQIVFPGIVAPRYMVATRTLGARPDSAIIYALPQAGSPDTGGQSMLSFMFNGVPVYWTNCLCDRGTISITTHGHYQVFVVLDRRWLWRKSWITQAYNVRRTDGSIDPGTQQSLAGIVSDIFAVIGESVDVSAVSAAEYPEVIYDRDNCVDMLEELLHSRGYVISLNTNDTVTIYRRGVGSVLPVNYDVVNQSISINPPERPLYLTALCNKTVIQSKLLMKPVGIDTDGQIRLVEDLSYAPAGGWNDTDLIGFNHISDPIEKELAIKSVGKWYQVHSQADETFDISSGDTNYNPGQFTVSDASQYLPLSDDLLSSHSDVYGGVVSNKSYVEGTFLETVENANPPRESNTDDFTRVDSREWSLDTKRGIVKFIQPALRKDAGPVAGALTFAKVYLTCSYSVHDSGSYVKERHFRVLNLGGLGEEIEEVDELQRQIIVSYSGSSVTGISDNLGTVNTAADLYLQSSQYKYATQSGNTLLYRGIYPLNTDGITLQIRWDVAVPGPVPFGTHATQYSEGLVLLPTDRERSLLRRAKMAADPMIQRKRRYYRSKQEV